MAKKLSKNTLNYLIRKSEIDGLNEMQVNGISSGCLIRVCLTIGMK
jgi:hypothetical protein